jgi:diguanylate cyclase (GGDEF)-like protein
MSATRSSSTYSLTGLGLSTMTRCGAALRALGSGAKALEDVAEAIVRHLHHRLVDDLSGEPATALVRFYKTRPFEELDEGLRMFARARVDGAPLPPRMKCLTLLASAGEQPDWNSPATSVAHRVIPLSSQHMLVDFPMIAHLLRQFGMDAATLGDERPDLMVDTDQHTYNVFYVPEAAGSPEIPAQDDFVVPFGIRSVLGFGGLLADGDLFAVILFSRVHISREAAALFRTLSLSVKLAVLPFSDSERTLRSAGGGATPRATDDLGSYRSRLAGLEQLLDVQEHMVIEQSGQIERANRELARLASTDALTGVANHRVFRERIDTEHKRAIRNQTTLGLLMIDIDHFKAFNDTLGHIAGDACLAAVAGALRGCINRGTDILARYGGEEFAVILPETDLAGVTTLAQAMRAAIETLALTHPASPDGEIVSISIGGAAERPSRGSSVEALIQHADVLLYRAKAEGRNRVIVE